VDSSARVVVKCHVAGEIIGLVGVQIVRETFKLTHRHVCCEAWTGFIVSIWFDRIGREGLDFDQWLVRRNGFCA
ncbi:MAG: hypothetical protein N3G20_09615, partial [Verrucomicrobiae bacterium]|nr:hypothetical protein [Verrucomicrobiae bacterium]